MALGVYFMAAPTWFFRGGVSALEVSMLVQHMTLVLTSLLFLWLEPSPTLVGANISEHATDDGVDTSREPSKAGGVNNVQLGLRLQKALDAKSFNTFQQRP